MIGVIEGLDAEMVAGAEQRLPPLVPYDKREVAEQALGAVLPPALIGGQEKLSVADLGRPPGQAQGVDELRAVVEPNVGGEKAVGWAADKRTCFVKGRDCGGEAAVR